MHSGMYSIINKKTGKRYIGQTVNFKQRFRLHKLKLRRGTHENSLLQRAWDKYKEEAFEFKVMEYVDKQYLTQREQWWMDLFGAYLREYGYNLNPSASDNPMLGKNHTSEARAKISEKAKGRKLSDYVKKRLSEAQKGVAKNSSRKVSPKKNPARSYSPKWTYYLTSPQGEEFITDNIGNFCRDNLLTRTHLVNCVVNKTFYKGWSGYRIPFQTINKSINKTIGDIKQYGTFKYPSITKWSP